MGWKKISKGRIQREAAGFFVIKPENCNEPVPLFCPVCLNAMKDSQDALYYRKWKACFSCSTMHAEPNRERWLGGWRPDLLRADE